MKSSPKKRPDPKAVFRRKNLIIWENIWRAALERGIQTKRELADRCGMTGQDINVVRRGEHLGAVRLAKLLDGLGLTIDQVMCPHRCGGDSTPPFNDRASGDWILSMLHDIDDAGQLREVALLICGFSGRPPGGKGDITG